MKKCNKCGIEKPFTSEYFPINNEKASGLRGDCKECRSLQKKEYRDRNRERISKHKKEWRESNKEKVAEYDKEYRKNNPERCRVNWGKSRARKRSLPHTLTFEEWEDTLLYFDGCCAYCGSSEKITQEHFVPIYKDGGYTKNNIIPACNSCNDSKGRKDFNEWYSGQPFYDEDRKNKILDFLDEGSQHSTFSNLRVGRGYLNKKKGPYGPS